MNKGAIAAIVVGSICGVALITTVIVLVVKRHHPDHNPDDDKDRGGRSEKLQLDPTKGSKVATWSWKGTSTGGFGGYGIFGNSKDIDYTFIKCRTYTTLR